MYFLLYKNNLKPTNVEHLCYMNFYVRWYCVARYFDTVLRYRFTVLRLYVILLLFHSNCHIISFPIIFRKQKCTALIKMSRKARVCVILGKHKELSANMLPTIADVLKALSNDRGDNIMEGKNRNNNLIRTIARKVSKIWERLLIPIVSESRIVFLINKLQKQRKMLLKSFKRDGNRPTYQAKLKKFQEQAKLLLDIAICKCRAKLCYCEKKLKVRTLLKLY